MASADYFLSGHPDAARAALAEALGEHGFAVSTGPDGSWEVTRGSATATALLGALAGRKNQRLVYTVRFFDHQGTPVARFARDSGAGAMGGAFGVQRSENVFAEVSEAVAARLHARGHLAHLLRGA
ncbi:hypothetical protein [Cellulomonas pakistanensis]|uniref:Uncharacterized protein n=1 Tax=Cellulomonas pakistanensis TaxID=992287 RepID=A0A919PC21_9CELL|nr:hypothetical protein [Cellulomonas pakistanensis]GIG36916.1 hypothetical protein Cpa01nite_22970 [Cellulomonas pakistanensis]